ncbi:hypothetical protein [Kitasatospora sp. NPDC051705]|uniref:hypothetical protein n=1 Tax=Kitasatospora sp. NPDC051705 TaxID=3364057 RepID=UPI003792C57C
MTPGLNNPLEMGAHPVGHGYTFIVQLSPNGHDNACYLQMEINPIDARELRDLFDALQASLVH